MEQEREGFCCSPRQPSSGPLVLSLLDEHLGPQGEERGCQAVHHGKAGLWPGSSVTVSVHTTRGPRQSRSRLLRRSSLWVVEIATVALLILQGPS